METQHQEQFIKNIKMNMSIYLIEFNLMIGNIRMHEYFLLPINSEVASTNVLFLNKIGNELILVIHIDLSLEPQSQEVGNV